MISQDAIAEYRGTSLIRGASFCYIPSHPLLRPYISNYTVTFPTVHTMPDEYTILPTASSTLVISAGTGSVTGILRGVNTKACTVGAFANRMALLLLIEFRPGGLYPFLRLAQTELADTTCPLDALDPALDRALENALLRSGRVNELVDTLDRIFLSGLVGDEACEGIAGILKMIIISHGNISARDLSSELYYSEKQIRRLFHRYVGVGPKTFSRIARVNYALRLLQRQPRRLANIAAQSGFSTSRTLFMIFTQFAGSRPRSICGTCPFFTMTVTKCDV